MVRARVRVCLNRKLIFSRKKEGKLLTIHVDALVHKIVDKNRLEVVRNRDTIGVYEIYV